jgi:hypothetical protein
MLRRGVRNALLIGLCTAAACSEPGAAAPESMGNAPSVPGSDAGSDSGSAAAGSNDGGLSANDASSRGDGANEPSADALAVSTRSNLQWKRYAAFEADLARALGLPKEQLCVELGRESCVRGVHLAPLGGHDPFATGLLEPSAEPLATTPTVVERIVVSACAARLKLDRKTPAADSPFAAIDLGQPAPAASASKSRELVTQLYRRLLGRDADSNEIDLVTQLAVDDQGAAVTGQDFALSACIAVGTSSEFLFF